VRNYAAGNEAAERRVIDSMRLTPEQTEALHQVLRRYPAGIDPAPILTGTLPTLVVV